MTGCLLFVCHGILEWKSFTSGQSEKRLPPSWRFVIWRMVDNSHNSVQVDFCWQEHSCLDNYHCKGQPKKITTKMVTLMKLVQEDEVSSENLGKKVHCSSSPSYYTKIPMRNVDVGCCINRLHRGCHRIVHSSIQNLATCEHRRCLCQHIMEWWIISAIEAIQPDNSKESWKRKSLRASCQTRAKCSCTYVQSSVEATNICLRLWSNNECSLYKVDLSA